MDLRVGCGGWWRFEGGLPRYSRRYNFVELNASYYRLPNLERARQWRRAVPEDFEFAVKVPRDEPSEPGQFLDVLYTLGARYVIIHRTSGWWSRAMELVHDHGYVPVLETRGWRDPGLPAVPSWAMVATDPSLPDRGSAHGAPEVYARIFGTPRGVAHHLGQEGLERVTASLRAHAVSGRGRVRIVTHSYQMYDDAERIRQVMGGRTDG